MDKHLGSIAEKLGLRSEQVDLAMRMIRLITDMGYLTAEEQKKLLSGLVEEMSGAPPPPGAAGLLGLAGPEGWEDAADRAGLDEEEQKSLLQALSDPMLYGAVGRQLERITGFQMATPETGGPAEQAAAPAAEEGSSGAAGSKPETGALKDDKGGGSWEVLFLGYDPAGEIHQITLVKKGVTIELPCQPAEENFLPRDDGDRFLGMAGQWGLEPEQVERLAAASCTFRTPSPPGLEGLVKRIQKEYGPFDSLFCCGLSFELPNPSGREESMQGEGYSVERSRSYGVRGIQLETSAGCRMRWPGGHQLVDSSGEAPRWGLLQARERKREIKESWQLRTRWKLIWKRLSGTVSPEIGSCGESMMQVRKQGSGGLHGEIGSYAGLFAEWTGDGGNLMHSGKEPGAARKPWDIKSDFSTGAMQIVGERTTDLGSRSHVVRSKRQPTIRRTPALSETHEFPLKESGAAASGICGEAVIETSVYARETDTTNTSSSSVQTETEWRNSLVWTADFGGGDSLELRFEPGMEEAGLLSYRSGGAGKRYAILQKEQEVTTAAEKEIEAEELRYHGWETAVHEEQSQQRIRLSSRFTRRQVGLVLGAPKAS